MTAIDRLVANSNSIIYSYKAFSAAAVQDVTFTWINDDDSETAITFNNIKKYQDKIASDMNTYTENLTAEKNTFKDEITQSFNDQKTAIDNAYDTFVQDVATNAINATNIKYVDGVAKDKDDNVLTLGKSTEDVVNDIGMKLVDGAIIDKDGEIVPMGGNELVALDSNHVGTYIPGEHWDECTAYSRCHQYSKGQFAVSTNTFNNVLTECEMRIAPFQVDQVTGKMTWGNFGYGYQNTEGYVHSTQSFGFCGNIGMAWGNSAWGSDTAHHQGGCTWRVNDDNTVTKGSNTGNTAYAEDNTSNGMLALYAYSDKVYWNIPNGAHTSIGNMTESNASVNDWSGTDEFAPGGSTNYIWRCVGVNVGENHAGLVSNSKGVAAMRADGSNGTTGSYVVGGQTRDGIGFELASGKQLFLSSVGTFVRESKTGGCVAGKLVDVAHSLGGGVMTNKSYLSGGYPAKEEDTFYIASAAKTLAKIKFVEEANNEFSMTTLGIMSFDSETTSDLSRYDGLMDVTGDDDKFVVVSVRHSSYQPTHTVVYENPMKDL